MMASKAAVSGMGWKLHTGSVAYSVVFTYKYVSSIGEKSKAMGYGLWMKTTKSRAVDPVLKLFRTERKLAQEELVEKVGVVTSST